LRASCALQNRSFAFWAAHLPITKTAIADYTLMQYSEALCMMVSRVFSFDFDVDDVV
jgi:hypothetical protein